MNTTASKFKKQQAARRLSQCSICFLGFALLTAGCQVQPPGGLPIQADLLGTVVDQANKTQEENAEASKFIIYMHEFEANTPSHADITCRTDTS